MVRFFDKLKDSFRKKDPSTPPEDSSSPNPESETPTSPMPDANGTALATASPAVVVDAALSPTSSETRAAPSASSTVGARVSRVKVSRVQVRRSMRPRPVIREAPVMDREDPEDTGLTAEPGTPHELAEDSETATSNPEPVRPAEDPEAQASSSEPVTRQEEAEQSASSAGHVIRRKPHAQKRQRKIRVVKPKIRVVR